MQDRLIREQIYFDELVLKGSVGDSLLGRMSAGFYDKSRDGRLWAPVWEKIDMRGRRVLDYCCGDGFFSRLLTSLGAHVYSVDISPQLIAQARAASEAGNNGVPQFLVGDGHQTPFPDNCFDYVVGNGVLHHLDLDRAYAEIARLLKPGGKAFFMEPMFHHPAVWLLRRLTPKLHTQDERPLSIVDIEKARRWFSVISHREHFLFAVCAAPVRLLGRRSALRAIGGVDRLDQALMRLVPPLRRLAWLTMLEMEK